MWPEGKDCGRLARVRVALRGRQLPFRAVIADPDVRHAMADWRLVALPNARRYSSRASMSEERLIKKYANRRLYDASQSRHITLADIRNLVVAGVRVRVIEDKTNEDITRVILLQVIADQEQFGAPILSTPLLEALIRFYGNSLQSFLSAHLEKSVESFMSQRQKEADSG
jgi:polyhydroxyalkanoate synthesis repressor PhaR